MKKTFTKISLIIISSGLCMGSGYKGSLPDINAAFDYIRTTPQTSKGVFSTSDDVPISKIKKSPKENKAYIDIILKKDRTSPYTNDLQDVIILFEKMDKCIKNNGSVQKFNAIASSIIDHADFMREKYEGKPERYYISFAKLQNVAIQAREIAALRCESQIYSKYLTYEGEGQIYSKDNINAQLKRFDDELIMAIKIMKDSI